MARRRQAWSRDAFVNFTQVSKAWCKSDRIDAVFLLLMYFYDLVDTDVTALGDDFEVGAGFKTVVDRQCYEFTCRGIDIIQIG